MTRICLDSNVLVAAFVARGLCADVVKLVLAEFQLIIPEVVASEVRRVMSEKLQAGPAALSAMEAVLDRCEIVPGTDAPTPLPLRDPDDERVLAEAVAAGAQILVSGDEDLLVVAGESPIRILSPKAFIALARGGTL